MKLNLSGFEIITAITTTYQEEIESYLLEEDGEVCNLELAHIVMDLCHSYAEEKGVQSHNELISLIQSKHIKLEEVI